MTTEQFEEKQAAMSDKELIELAEKQIHKLAKTGGESHKMCVPPIITDTDMLLCELVKRYKGAINIDVKDANRVLVTELEYFGTDLSSPGHFFWQLDEDRMSQNRSRGFHNLPFNPENLTSNMENGDVTYYNAFGFSICAIAGSCIDERRGCKSIFWTNDQVDNWKKIIESIPIAKKVIDQMPFKVKWS